MRALALLVALGAGYGSLGLLDPALGGVAFGAWGLSEALRLGPASLRARVPWGLGAIVWGLGISAWALAAAPAAIALLGAVLVGLQLHRRASRSEAADDRVSLVLSGLMLVAAAGGTRDAAFLVPAGLWGAALPVALLSEGRRGTVGWWPLHALVAAALFLLLPRPAPRNVDPPEVRLTGFAPDVALGALEPLLDDPGRVLTARVPEGAALPERVLWRGLALDGFDGVRWYASTPPQPATLAGARGVPVEVTLAQGADGVLFAPGRVTGLDVPGVRADRQGAWFVGEGRAMPGRYTVHVVPAGEGDAWFEEPRGDRGRWLELPPLDPAVGALAREIAGEGSPRQRIDRLATWLDREVTYTRDALGADATLERFLLQDRRGHCEFVAAGLAVLARSVDVPSRVVTGFASSETDPVTGERVVRRQHAHAWTEVLLDDRWVAFDATPGAQAAPVPPAWARVGEGVEAWWSQQVVGFDRDDQRGAVYATARRVEAWLRLPGWATVPWRGLVVLGSALGLLLLGARVLARWLRRAEVERPLPRGPVARQHARARRALAEAGHAPPAPLPPVDAAAWLEGRVPPEVVEAQRALAWLYYAVALGGRTDAEAGPEARALADRVVRALREQATGPS